MCNSQIHGKGLCNPGRNRPAAQPGPGLRAAHAFLIGSSGIVQRESLDGGIRLPYPLGEGCAKPQELASFPSRLQNPNKKSLRCEGEKKNIQEPPSRARGTVGDGTALLAASTTGFLWDIFKQIPVNPPREAKLGESTKLSLAQGEGGEASCLTWLLPPRV